MGSPSQTVPTWVVLVALVVVQTGFGAYGPFVTKFGEQKQVNPLVFSLIRDSCTFPILMLAAFIAEKTIMVPTLREMPLFIFLGFLGIFAAQLMYILGVYWAGPNIASAFQPATPVWSAIFAILFRVEKLPPLRALHSWAKLLGILCAATGAIGMTVFRQGSSSVHPVNTNTTDVPAVTTDCHAPTTKHSAHEAILGCVMVLGNTISASIFIVLMKKYIFNQPEMRYSDMPVNVVAFCYMWGAFFMAAASPMAKFIQQEECGVKASPWTIPLQATYPLIFAIFIVSALCYLLATWATKQIPVTVVTAFWPLQVWAAFI